ncbi:MAG: endonuclease III domain-containing protein [Promethearchaeota archaeon]|jgi:endonuclease-3
MKYKEILDRMGSSLQGEAHLDELANIKQDPFKILISTILSARTRDANTKIATERLFAKYNSPNLIATADNESLEDLIRASGFYRIKASRIKEVSKVLLDNYNGKVPKDFEDLISLPGVGAKTANCVLVYAFREAAIPVDTHVHRISNRLGWAKTVKPEQTEKALKEVVPKSLWIQINRIFVRFGQEICLPLRPKCDICPVEKMCSKDFSMETERKKKKNKSK